MAAPLAAPAAVAGPTKAEIAAMLADGLKKFGSTVLPEPTAQQVSTFGENSWIASLGGHYKLHPDKERAFLGAGGYGAAYKVKSVKRPSDPVRVCKVIIRDRVASAVTQVLHMCAELAVSGLLSNPHLNRRVDLFHTSTHMFIILEMAAGPRPDVLTRVAHIIATRRPSRIGDIEAVVTTLAAAAKAQGVDPTNEEAFGDFFDHANAAAKLAQEVGVNVSKEKPEYPWATDLFGLICAHLKLPDPVARVVTRQALLGLECMHQSHIVHRDIKTENVVVGVTRKAELIKEGGKTTGVKFTDKYDVKIIDFGLVKYMNLDSDKFGYTTTPGAVIRATGSGDVEEADPFADPFDPTKYSVVAKPQTAGGSLTEVIVTPACTEVYAPLESIQGMLRNGGGTRKFASTKATLPKVDVYGVGTMLFCMSNGRPPFKSRLRDRAANLRAIELAIMQGLQFSSSCSKESKEFTELLMQRDVAKRPTAGDALRFPFCLRAGDTVISIYKVDGTCAIGLEKDMLQFVKHEEPKGKAAADDEDGEDDLAADEAAVAAAARHHEDDGDSQQADESSPKAPRAAGHKY